MSSRENDPNPQGGSITDMAVEGTTVPADSAKPNYIPSKPRPGQATDTLEDPNDLGASDLASAADNAGDIPRSTRDKAPNEILTTSGDSLPAEVDQKRLHNVAQGDLSKGHPRYDKHVRQQGSDYDKGAADGGEEQEVRDGVVGGR